MIVLASLTQAELRRLEAVLRAVPPEKALDAIDWEAVGKAGRSRTATADTVAGALAQIEALQSGHRARAELEMRLERISKNLRDAPLPPIGNMSVAEKLAALPDSRWTKRQLRRLASDIEAFISQSPPQEAR